MVVCAIVGCKSRSEPNVRKKYHHFPKDENIRKQWVAACGKRKSFKIECARICSEHFIQSDFKLQDILLRVPEHKRRLRSGAVPSKNLPGVKLPSKQEIRRKQQENKALVEESLAYYERKRSGIQRSSDENSHEVQEEKIPTDGHLTSNVSNNASNASDYLTDKSREEHSYSQIKYYTNGSTQTELDYDCCKELHIMRLERENRKLKAVIKNQVKRAQENEALRSSLRGIMTLGQINRLLHPGRQLKWRTEDIASAMSLYSAGPGAYALLRKRNFPLPSSSTLRGRAGQIEIKPGLLASVLQLMKKLDYKEKDRLCVLCFGKIRLKSSSYSDKGNNQSLTRVKFAHVVMVRGLIKDWIQIIYYDLDVRISVSALKSIIVELEDIHFVVTAVVIDMGSNVPTLWHELNISENQPFFCHPCDEYRKIFFFADVLHLIKLLRNRFIDTGLVLHGKSIDTEPIKEVLDIDKVDVGISHEHLLVQKCERRKIHLATQLFSGSVSTAIRKQISLGKIQSLNALDCALFIEIVNDWIEIFNARIDSKERVNAYGSSLERQNNIIVSMSEAVRNMKRKAVLSFQNEILINNSALPQMLDYIKQKYNVACILSDRLNHGELEHFFDIIRVKRGPRDHPTPLEFKYRLRSFILGKMIL